MNKHFDFAKLMASGLNKNNPKKSVALQNKTAAGEPEIFYDLNSDVLSLCENLRERGHAQKAAALEKRFFMFKQAERGLGKEIAGEKIMDKAHPGVVKLKGVGGDTEVENKQDLQEKILGIIKNPVKVNKKADSIISKIRRFADTRPPEMKNFIIISDAVITSGDKSYSSEYLNRTIVPALTDLKNIFETLKSQLENKKSNLSAGGLDYYSIKNDLDKKQTDLETLLSAISKNENLPGWKDDLVSWVSSLFAVVNETNSKVMAGFVGARYSNFFDIPKSFVQDTISIRMALPYANVIANCFAKYKGENKKYCYVMPGQIVENNIFFYNPKTFAIETVDGQVREELVQLLPEPIQQKRQAYLDAFEFWKQTEISMPLVSDKPIVIFTPKNPTERNKYTYKMGLMDTTHAGTADNLFVGNVSEKDRANVTRFGHGKWFVLDSGQKGKFYVWDSLGNYKPGLFEKGENETLIDEKNQLLK